jgi:hypothetical protein
MSLWCPFVQAIQAFVLIYSGLKRLVGCLRGVQQDLVYRVVNFDLQTGHIVPNFTSPFFSNFILFIKPCARASKIPNFYYPTSTIESLLGWRRSVPNFEAFKAVNISFMSQ